MNQIASIARALIKGDVLTIMDGFKKFSCSNVPREISRSIEAKFNVVVSRERVDFTTEDGMPGHFFKYRLNKTAYNKDGILRMVEYIQKQSSKAPPRTKKEEKAAKELSEITLFTNSIERLW